MSTTTALNREAIASVDASDELSDILEMPDQLRDALWRVESSKLDLGTRPAGSSSPGMGGSAIGGSLARAVLGDRASRPIVLARGYGLPAWTTPDTMVLCASYSGNTEETLAAYEAAGALGAQRIVATTGGKLAAAARAESVPVDPAPRRASSRAPPSPTRWSWRSRSRDCAAPATACTPRLTSPLLMPSAWWRSGVPRATRTRCPRSSRAGCTGRFPRSPARA